MLRNFFISVKSIGMSVYDKTHWFSDDDAWRLFRLFAFVEAMGWTLLIGAIMYRSFDLVWDDIFVSFAGTIHGVFFLLYFVFVLITARSMEWGLGRITLALAAGIPPYTSLVFEQAMARHRKRHPQSIAPPLGYDD